MADMADGSRRLPTRAWFLDEVGSAGRENLDAEHVARYDAKVDAVDVSPVMLRRLQAKVDASKASNVEVVQSGFLSYESMHGVRRVRRTSKVSGSGRSSKSTSVTSTPPSSGSSNR